MPSRELPPGTDLLGRQQPGRTAQEKVMADGRHARVEREIAEIRKAAELMKADGGTDWQQQTAEFLTTQAERLKRENNDCLSVELPWDYDTREKEIFFDTPSRSALLIARAYLEEKSW